MLTPCVLRMIGRPRPAAMTSLPPHALLLLRGPSATPLHHYRPRLPASAATVAAAAAAVRLFAASPLSRFPQSMSPPPSPPSQSPPPPAPPPLHTHRRGHADAQTPARGNGDGKATMLATKTATAARTSQMPPSPPKDLLAEPNLTAQAQRRADWGIIKEMSLYLWPKVRPVCLLPAGLSPPP